MKGSSNFVDVGRVYNYYCYEHKHASDTEPCPECPIVSPDDLYYQLNALGKKKVKKDFSFVPAVVTQIEQELIRLVQEEDAIVFTAAIYLADGYGDPNKAVVGFAKVKIQEWNDFADRYANMDPRDKRLVAKQVFDAFEQEWNQRHPKMQLQKSGTGRYKVAWE